MQIAIVTETWPPEVNGVALTVHALARGLHAGGHAVEIIRPRQAGEVGADADDGFSAMHMASVPLPRYPGLRVGLPARSRLVRHWRTRTPDAVYVATEGPLGHSALAAARRLGIRACTGFHTRFDDFVRHYGIAWMSPLVFAGLRRFHNQAAATLVPTRELATFLQDRGFRNVRVLRRAVDTALFDPCHRDLELRTHWGVAEHALAVVHVGRLAAEKNLDLAVQAFRAIAGTQPDARFIIVGDGPERARLAAAHPDFIFAGVRRGADLARHYASADLFLFPSTTETFGNVTLEALASGVPLVAFDHGAAREHLTDARAGACIPFADGCAFIDSACSLAGDAVRRQHMRRHARNAVEALSVARVNADFASLLAGHAWPEAA